MDHAFGVASGHHHGQGHLGFLLFKEFESSVFHIWISFFVKGIRFVSLQCFACGHPVGPAPFVLYHSFLKQ